MNGAEYENNYGPGGATGAALRSAAANGDANGCIRLLGSARCVRFSRDPDGHSALHLAAAAGHAHVMRILLNVAAPKEVDILDGYGYTPLQRAAANGHEHVLKLLLSRGADVNKQDSVYGNSAIHEAAWKGYSRSVRIVIAAGANLSRPNNDGFTPLHLSCQNGHNQSCREILLAGCSPDIQNFYGDTALHTAARYGHSGATRILISAQCAISDQNKNGDTALHISAAMGRSKLTRILLEAGCDKTVKNKQGETARDIAVRKNLCNIIALIDSEVVGTANKNEHAKTHSKKKKSSKKTSRQVRDVKNEPTATNTVLSPYGCHFYPPSKAFPEPKLNTLPAEPLKHGEQYYLDLGGNICKGPVGVGAASCYCTSLFQHLEARLERDKYALQKSQMQLSRRVAGLEQKIFAKFNVNNHDFTKQHTDDDAQCCVSRSRSLEMLDKADSAKLTTRSLEKLDDDNTSKMPSVRELVARIQLNNYKYNGASSSSDEEKPETTDVSPLRMAQQAGPMGNSNLVVAAHNQFIGRHYENVPKARSRSTLYFGSNNTSSQLADVFQPNSQPLTVVKSAQLPLRNGKPFPIVVGENTRETTNDSGYSTRVYNSSKGNSPNLSTQLDGIGDLTTNKTNQLSHLV